MLGAAEEGDLVYIENQYFFDHGIVSEIHEAAERGAKIIVILTSQPDEDSTIIQRVAEKILETISCYEDIFPLVKGHENVGIFTLGNRSSRGFSSGIRAYIALQHLVIKLIRYSG